mgnify:CR=1 FL=1
MLEDDQARQRLIEDLRRMESERGSADTEAAPEPALADRIAGAARTTAQEVAARFGDTVAAVTTLLRPSERVQFWILASSGAPMHDNSQERPFPAYL